MAQSSKTIIKKLLGSRTFLFLIALALIGLIISVGRESYRKYQLTREINDLKSEIERMEGSNQQMADLMEYFQQDSYLEKEARLKFNLKKPGEKVVIISDNSVQEPAQPEQILADQDSPDQAMHWKWWEYFFQ